MGIKVSVVALLTVMSRREPEQPGELTRAIAREIRAEMGRQQISAVVLAQRSGVGYRTLIRYLNAERTFSLEVLDKLAGALGMTGTAIMVAARPLIQREAVAFPPWGSVELL